MLNPVVVIPARLQAARLPGKPLADIHGEPMIVHVWRRAVAAAIGPVVVACAEQMIADAVTGAGGNAVLTRSHPTGSDRVFEAVEKFDPGGNFNAVVNLQGDLPAITPSAIHAAFTPLENEAVDIATLVAEIADDGDRHNPNVVKAAIPLAERDRIGRILYFSRGMVPAGEGPTYRHVGLYVFRRAALARFARLPQGVLERRERLEQLRALEYGMRVDAALIDTLPLAVETPADLERARHVLVRLH